MVTVLLRSRFEPEIPRRNIPMSLSCTYTVQSGFNFSIFSRYGCYEVKTMGFSGRTLKKGYIFEKREVTATPLLELPSVPSSTRWAMSDKVSARSIRSPSPGFRARWNRDSSGIVADSVATQRSLPPCLTPEVPAPGDRGPAAAAGEMVTTLDGAVRPRCQRSTWIRRPSILNNRATLR